MIETDVLVVGGGVAGGATACALGSRGMEVTILERKRSESTVNRGEVLHAGAQMLLERWGVMGEFEPVIAARLERYRMHHHFLGMVADFDQRGDIVVPHPVIEEVLVRFAEEKLGATVLRGTAARELFTDDGRAVGVSAHGPEGSVEVQARLTVGADGSSSFVRRALDIDCPVEPYDHELCYAEAPRQPGMLGNEIYLGGRGFVMRRPIGPDRMRVSFATPAGDGSRMLRLSEHDLANELGRRSGVFRGWRIDRDGRHVYALTRQHACSYWRPGAVLVGDAAHVNHPATGTGMHMAMQDAEALAEQLAGGIGTREDVDSALARYEADRRVQVAANIERTHQVATFVLGSGMVAAFRRFMVLLAYRLTGASRRVPLLALPKFSVTAVLRAAFQRRPEGKGVYK
jgi:2-polyprenyl-6-methoxyphenol hydroxylase-like FAD-dependent oxidoreductase